MECEHTEKFRMPGPTIGDRIYCVKCEKGRLVTSYQGEWHSKCKECRHRMSYGLAEITANTKAAYHALMKSHTVVVWQEGTQHAREIAPKKQPALTDDRPPF